MISLFLNPCLAGKTAKFLLVILLIVLVAFPWVMGEGGRYYTFLLMTVFIFAALGHAWNLLAGFCGLLSFGLQVYIGLAGFTVAIANYYGGINVWWTLPIVAIVCLLFSWLLAAPISGRGTSRTVKIGIVIAVLLALLYEGLIWYEPAADIFGGAYIRRMIILLLIFLGALPLLKLQGAYFAVATWLIAAAVASIFSEWRVVGAGGGMNIVSDTSITDRYYAGLIIVIASTAMVWWLLHSRYGKALTAVRDNEEAASSIGIDIRRVKTLVFVISAPIAGLAAALFYIDSVTITPTDAFSIRWSAYMVFIVVAGGMGSLSGPVIGALVFVLVDRILVGFWGGGALTLGIASVLLILLLPRGIAGVVSDLREKAKSIEAKPKPVQASMIGKLFGSKQNVVPVEEPIGPPGIVSAFLVPGNPLPWLNQNNPPWRPIVDGFASARTALLSSKPDVIIIYASQWYAVMDQLWQTRSHLAGTHVDENWYEYGDLPYDIRVDTAVAEAMVEGCRAIGISAKAVNYSQFPIDSGTISANGFLNSEPQIPLVIAANNLYHDQKTTAQLGEMAAKRAVAMGKRVAIVAIGGLSGAVHRSNINIAEDTVSDPVHDAANLRMLKLIKACDIAGINEYIKEFQTEAQVDNEFKQFAWIQGALGGKWDGAKILGYGPIYGSGNAVIQFNLTQKPI